MANCRVPPQSLGQSSTQGAWEATFYSPRVLSPQANTKTIRQEAPMPSKKTTSSPQSLHGCRKYLQAHDNEHLLQPETWILLMRLGASAQLLKDLSPQEMSQLKDAGATIERSFSAARSLIWEFRWT